MTASRQILSHRGPQTSCKGGRCAELRSTQRPWKEMLLAFFFNLKNVLPTFFTGDIAGKIAFTPHIPHMAHS